MTDRQLRANDDDGSPVPQEPHRTSRVDVVGCAVQLTATTQTPLQQRRRDQADRAARRLSDEVTTGGIHVTTTGQHHNRIRRGRLLTTAVLAAAVTIVTAGCTKEPKASPPAISPTASPSPATDPQAAEKTAVLAAYNSFWSESVKAYAAGSDKDTQLVKYAAKKALDEALTDITNLEKNGLVMQGAPKHRAQTTALTMTGERPRATVTDCLDISTWRTVERSTGKEQPNPSEQPLRYEAVAEVEQWSGQWMVVTMTPNGDRTC